MPAFSILAAVLILILLVAVSTHRNLDRQKKRAMQYLQHQGLSIIRSLEAGARSGMMMHHVRPENSTNNLIREAGKDEEIAYIYICNAQGMIIHASNPSRKNNPCQRVLKKADSASGDAVAVKIDETVGIYELSKRFQSNASFRGMRHRHGMMGMSRFYEDAWIILGIKMAAYQKAWKADFRHALFMTAILVVLGSGAIFFLFFIQNYYIVAKALRQTRDYTRQVVASMPNGLVSIDARGKLISYNLQALDLLKIDENEAHGLHLQQLLDFEETGIQAILANQPSHPDREIQYHPKKSDPIPLSISVSPIQDGDGECTGAVIVLRDLSEIKALEQKVRRSEKLAAIGRLAAGVAHEIRNPLSSIRGFAQFLAHVLQEKPKEREYAQIMVKEIDRINLVVTDLLILARPFEPNFATSDVSDLLRHTVRLLEPDAHSKGVTIQVNSAQSVGEVMLDANKLTQALLNLLLNAVQAVQANGKIEAGAATDQSNLYMWVEDNGPGISAEHQKNIFDPFFSTREKGSGLGLAILNKIVEGHSGEVRVQSPPPGRESGCRFTIRIPIQETDIK